MDPTFGNLSFLFQSAIRWTFFPLHSQEKDLSMKTLASKFVYLTLLLTMLASCSDDSGSSYYECEQCTLPPSSEASSLLDAPLRITVTIRAKLPASHARTDSPKGIHRPQ